MQAFRGLTLQLRPEEEKKKKEKRKGGPQPAAGILEFGQLKK
jgi:hypothetical protein